MGFLFGQNFIQQVWLYDCHTGLREVCGGGSQMLEEGVRR